MKAVLISIQPKWCELIASGKKTIEVRKTAPKSKTPFKVYIYCTHGDSLNYLITSYFSNANKFWVDNNAFGSNVARANGKVIGEFVCDKVTEIKSDTVYSKVFGGFDVRFNFDKYAACLTEKQIFDYLADGKGYAWHISNLKIYDKPKELSEFSKYGFGEPVPLKRPPQSWMYVEDGICP